jgi:class 3 adenylate cyclase
MEPSEEIRRVVERWMENAADPPSMMARLSEHPGLVLIGSDPNEWWQGPDARLVLEHRQQGEVVGSLKWVEVDAWEEGSCGWAAVRLGHEIRGVTLEVRLTCVLHLEQGDWKVVQMHQSLPQTNQSLGLPAASTFEELVEAARRERPELPASLSRDGTVTIVFTDIVDSTLWLSRRGDDAWVEVIRRHNELIDEVTSAHGGTVVETQGDGSMLAFSSARGAVTCSQAIQRAIEEAFADFSPSIRVRIGIHTGDAIEEAEHFFGTTVHYAARVASHAFGGEVLVSSTVRELVAGSASTVSFLEGREVELKGLEGSHHVYALAPS